MITAWTQNLEDPESKANFERSLQSSRVVLDRLQDLMNKELQSLENDEINVSSYDNPNWSHRQAHRNGFKNAIRKINILLDQKD